MPMEKRPTSTHGRRMSLFDRFAEAASAFTSHAAFFIACTLVVVLWLPSYFIVVALLQNSQRRSEQALHLKLDALAAGLADVVSTVGGNGDAFDSDVDELHEAVGAEHRD